MIFIFYFLKNRDNGSEVTEMEAQERESEGEPLIYEMGSIESATWLSRQADVITEVCS